MTHKKVEHCLKLDATVVREVLADVRYGVYVGSGSCGLPFTYHVTPRADGAYALDIWVHRPTPAHKGRIILTPTTPYYGGRRYWFLCPRCGRRCRVVYLPPIGALFGCRMCWELRYRSQSASTETRSIWRIETLKAKLGARGQATAVLAPTPLRPKRMHGKTYTNLLQQLRRAEYSHWQAMEQWLQRFKKGY